MPEALTASTNQPVGSLVCCAASTQESHLLQVPPVLELLPVHSSPGTGGPGGGGRGPPGEFWEMESWLCTGVARVILGNVLRASAFWETEFCGRGVGALRLGRQNCKAEDQAHSSGCTDTGLATQE